jgi:Tol biopolymer transport system component
VAERNGVTTQRRKAIAALAIASLFVSASLVGVGLWRINGTPTIQTVDRFGPVHGWIAFRDGSQIVAVDPTNPTNRIVVGDANGAEPLEWSRDGSRLLLYKPTYRGDKGLGRDLYVMNADGSQTQLTHDDDFGFGGSWSPDGTTVIHDVMHEGLYVVGAAGGIPRLLIPAEPQRYRWLESPTWSPDGSRIGFLEEFSDGVYAIWVVNADGRGQRRLADVGICGGGGCTWGLTWSPDGSRLAFLSESTRSATRPTREIGLHVVRADGSGRRQIVSVGSSHYGRFVSWSPDGSRIAFARDGELFIVAADGGDEQRVEGVRWSDARYMAIAWAPLR